MQASLLALIVPLLLSPVLLAADGPASEPATQPAGPLRIVAIGDSITQGRQGGGQHKPTFSWRYPLWKMLVDADAHVDFVGSLKVGFNGDPDWADYKGQSFDRDHEGHWGWTTAAIADKLPGWLEGYTPDVAMILLGSNDKEKDTTLEPTVKAMTDIITALRKKNPRVVVLLGQTFQEWKPFPALREAMVKLAKDLNTEASPVVIVDHSPGWVSKPDAPGTHTVDWVHPNVAGDEKLAKNWFKALKPYLRHKPQAARQ